jgi:hypothetical protein
MKKAHLLYVVLAVLVIASVSQAALITNVVRANGKTGDRPPIGVFDGSTPPLATQDGGLKDGNMLFSDRVHVWATTPVELIGAEYIRTFNNDKDAAGVTYTVTIGQSCILGMIIDNRVGHGSQGGAETLDPDLVAAGMQWVIDMGFVDTGLNIGIDENADGSVNNWSSIFSKLVGPGTYTFSAQNDVTNPGGRNMYGVGAIIPEPTTLLLLGLGGLIVSRKSR